MCGGGGEEVKPTEDMRAQAQNNAQLWNYYLKSYKPLIEKYTDRLTDPGQTETRSRNVAGRINADVMKNVTPENASLNPVVNAKAMGELADVEAGAKVQGQGGVRSREIADVQNVINIGRGEATTAQAGLDEIARQSLKREISSREADQLSDAATGDMIGSVSGAISAGLLRKKPDTKMG
jgi:hypothetical protein